MPSTRRAGGTENGDELVNTSRILSTASSRPSQSWISRESRSTSRSCKFSGWRQHVKRHLARCAPNVAGRRGLPPGGSKFLRDLRPGGQSAAQLVEALF